MPDKQVVPAAVVAAGEFAGAFAIRAVAALVAANVAGFGLGERRRKDDRDEVREAPL